MVCHILYTAKAHTAVTTLETGDVIIGRQLEMFSAKLLILNIKKWVSFTEKKTEELLRDGSKSRQHGGGNPLCLAKSSFKP